MHKLSSESQCRTALLGSLYMYLFVYTTTEDKKVIIMRIVFSAMTFQEHQRLDR